MNSKLNKIRHVLTLIFTIVFYFLSASFVHDLISYFFVDITNFFKDIFVVLPLTLLYSLPPYLYISYMIREKNISFRNMYRHRLIDRFVVAICSGITLFTLLLACFIKYRGELISNQFMMFFPLNIIIISFIVFSLSIISLFKDLRIPKESLNQLFEKTDIFEIKLDKKEKRIKIIKNILFGLFVVLAMFLFGQGANAIAYFDISKPMTYLGQIAMILLFIAPTLFYMAYIYGYSRHQDERRKRRFYKHHLIYFGAYLFTAFTLLIVGYIINPQFAIQAMSPIFFIDFASSIKITEILISLCVIVPYLTALIIYLVRHYGKRKN